MSTSFQLSSAVMTLFQLTNMNVFALDPAGRLITLHAPHDISDTLNQQAFRALTEAAFEKPDFCHFWQSDPLSYMAGVYDSSTVIVTGPFLTQIPDVTKTQLDKQVVRSLPILKRAAQQSIANVLMHLNVIDSVPLSFSSRPDVSPDDHLYLGEEDAAASLINLRYAVSNDMMHAIETGDNDALQSIIKKTGSLFDFSNRFPNKPLRSTKNNLIILNTTFRLAAERGGAPPVLLHQLSEKFAIAIERIDSVQALDQLSATMGAEYCQLVLDNRLMGYSMLIQQAIRHLHVHFTEAFDAAALAESLHVHPSHLARQFKKETGVTMVHFVQNLRINEAKRLLRKDLSSIEYIAGQCGFDDAAYFARVFKKIAAITPKMWRDGR